MSRDFDVEARDVRALSSAIKTSRVDMLWKFLGIKCDLSGWATPSYTLVKMTHKIFKGHAEIVVALHGALGEINFRTTLFDLL